MLEWLTDPYRGCNLTLVRSAYSYLVSYQFRVGARARHVIVSTGLKASYLSKRLVSRHRVIIASSAIAGGNLTLVHPIGIIVGADVELGNDVRLYQNVTIAMSRTGTPTRIGDNVIIYSNAVILGGVQVGDNSVIGAGAIVTKNIPDGAIVVGNPAKVLRFRSEKDSNLY